MGGCRLWGFQNQVLDAGLQGSDRRVGRRPGRSARARLPSGPAGLGFCLHAGPSPGGSLQTAAPEAPPSAGGSGSDLRSRAGPPRDDAGRPQAQGLVRRVVLGPGGSPPTSGASGRGRRSSEALTRCRPSGPRQNGPVRLPAPASLRSRGCLRRAPSPPSARASPRPRRGSECREVVQSEAATRPLNPCVGHGCSRPGGSEPMKARERGGGGLSETQLRCKIIPACKKLQQLAGGGSVA